MANHNKEKNTLGDHKIYNRKIVRQTLKRMYNTNKIKNWWKRLQGYPIG